jgi:hypothetical protein
MKPHVHTCVHACEPSGCRFVGGLGVPLVLRFAFCGLLNDGSMSFSGLPRNRALAARPDGFNDASHGGLVSAEEVISPNVLQRVGDLAEGGIP